MLVYIIRFEFIGINSAQYKRVGPWSWGGSKCSWGVGGPGHIKLKESCLGGDKIEKHRNPNSMAVSACIWATA